MEKRAYETPLLVDAGSFETLTQAAATGTSLDATFPTGTPNSELTFSD